MATTIHRNRRVFCLAPMALTAGTEAPILLVEATETKDCILTGVDHEKCVLEVLERSVKDKKDWDDAEKVEEKETTIPIPAAG